MKNYANIMTLIENNPKNVNNNRKKEQDPIISQESSVDEDAQNVSQKKEEKLNNNIERKEFYDKISDNLALTQLKSKVKDLFRENPDENVEFYFIYFLKYFLYHFLFQFILGPLSIIIIIPLEGYNMTYNMKFVGCDKFYFFNIFLYLCTAPTLFVILIKTNNLYPPFYIFPYIFLFNRILIISIRYAYTSHFTINKRKSSIFSSIENKREYIIFGWKEIDKEICEIEINESLNRQQIDTDLFTFTFINHLNDRYLEKLSLSYNNEFNYKEEYLHLKNYCNEEYKKYINIKVDFQETIKLLEKKSLKNISKIYGKSMNLILSENKKEEIIKFNTNEAKILPFFLIKPDNLLLKLKIPGILLITESIIFSVSNYSDCSKLFEYFIYVIIIVQNFIPMGFLINEDNTTLIEYVCLIFTIFLGIYANLGNMMFLLVSGNDYERRLFMMKYLLSMINLDKFSCNETEPIFKGLPIMNIFEEENYGSWMYFRLVAIDIGKRYLYRFELYNFTFFIVNAIQVSLVALNFFKDDYIFGDKTPLYNLMISIQAIMCFFILFRLIYYGAKVNEFSQIHIKKLVLLKSQLYLISRNSNLIKCNEIFLNSHFQLSKDFLVFDKNGKNIIGLTEEEFILKLNNCMTAIDFLIERIELDSRERPLRFLIVEMNFSLIYRIIVSLLSLTQYYFLNYLKR